MKVNPMDWPARPDLEATIAQQQARIEALDDQRAAVLAACDEFSQPGDDGTSGWSLAHIIRALLSPAPADAAHKEGTP